MTTALIVAGSWLLLGILSAVFWCRTIALRDRGESRP